MRRLTRPPPEREKKKSPIHKLDLLTDGDDWLPERHVCACVCVHTSRSVCVKLMGRSGGVKEKLRHCCAGDAGGSRADA